MFAHDIDAGPGAAPGGPQLEPGCFGGTADDHQNGNPRGLRGDPERVAVRRPERAGVHRHDVPHPRADQGCSRGEPGQIGVGGGIRDGNVRRLQRDGQSLGHLVIVPVEDVQVQLGRGQRGPGDQQRGGTRGLHGGRRVTTGWAAGQRHPVEQVDATYRGASRGRVRGHRERRDPSRALRAPLGEHGRQLGADGTTQGAVDPLDQQLRLTTAERRQHAADPVSGSFRCKPT